MVRVQVEFLSNPGRTPVEVEMSRVPCLGEYLVLEDDEDPKLVHVVYHFADRVQNLVAAIVRVKG